MLAAPSHIDPPVAPAKPSAAPVKNRSQRAGTPLYAALGAVAAIFATMVGAICLKCGGRFVYPLDDPYIHLALARQISHGHYGLNPTEPSAPSSSILWPFLLAPFAITSLFEYVPLFLNLVLTLLTVTCLFACLKESLMRPALAAALTVGTMVASNAIGVAITGMEHSLQMWVTVLVAYGLIRVHNGQEPPTSLPIALVIGPLVRYENLAVTVCASVYLYLVGHRRMAAISTLLPLVGVVAFSIFLRSQGLGILPSSVIAKSPAFGGIGTGQSLAPGGGTASQGGLRDAWHLLKAFLLTMPQHLATSFGAFSILAIACSWARKPTQSVLLWATLTSALILHLMFGRIGWFQRYEVYLYPFGIAILVCLRSQTLMAPFPLRPLVVALFLALPGVESLQTAYRTPLASACVYRQQYQMMRFVRDYYRRPVAVNDLGEVAFGSNQYVLDLWGLGSQEALKARLAAGGSGAWVGDEVTKKGIKLVMVYTEWFPKHPESWQLVAELHLDIPKVGIWGSTVSIFATDPTEVPRLTALLRRFALTLPSGAALETGPSVKGGFSI